jgi:signal transduction histidine kinase/CheY-like chemotaxis protein
MNDKLKIRSEQLEYLYKNLLSAVIGVISVSLIIYFVLKNEVSFTNLNIWLSLVFLISFLRILLLQKYNKTEIDEKNIQKFETLFSFFAYMTALLWALIPILILPKDIMHIMFLVLMIGGLTAGAIVSLAINNNLYRAYALISLLPFVFVFLYNEHKMAFFVAITVITYLILLFVMSKKINMIINDSIELTQNNITLIEQLKQTAKEAQKASEAKSSFLSTMSHEIRTPLNAIIGFIKILKKTEKDQERYKYLETIDQSSYSLLNIINDVLDFSKIESGKFDLDFVEFDPKEELGSLYKLYCEAASQNGVTLINSISEDMPSRIKTDKLRLKQIISNLISNAIKFTPENKDIYFIARFNSSDSSIYVEIKDEGIGIAQEKISLITEEFMQADNTTARQYGGTGLGLAIVIKLLKLFGSELKIQSEPNVGSSFYFELDVEVLEESRYEKSAQISENIDFSGKKILVAEDNPTNQMLIELLLNELKIKVTIANDGLQAQEMFKKDHFDMVLMDINMPNRNGIDAMKSINEYQKDSNMKVPVIALTANSISGDKERFLEEGFSDYISKPILMENLTAVLKKYIA